MVHPEVAGQFQVTVKRQRSGWFPNGWSDPPTQHMNSPSWQKLATPHSTAIALALCNGPHPAECASFYIRTNPPLNYCCVSNWMFAMRRQSLSFIRSWSQAPWVLAGLKSQERGAEGKEEKAMGKTCWGIPFTTSQKICYIPDLCSQFSLTWSMAQRRLGTEEHPPAWVTAIKVQRIVEPSGHTEDSLSRVPELPPLLLTCWQGIRENKKREIINELRFC